MQKGLFFRLITIFCILAVVIGIIPSKALMADADRDSCHEISETSGIIKNFINEESLYTLGNSINDIFQGGTEFVNDDYHFYSTYAGLYDVKKQEYLATGFKARNLNFFDGILYYTVDDENDGFSRVFKYSLLSNEVTTIYSHPSKIGQMYCVNNAFFLFMSDNKLYKKMIADNSIAQEVIFANNDMGNVPIFGLIPTCYGVILIGNKADDYSLFVDGMMFIEHVTYVSVSKEYLILGINGDDYQVNMKTLFERFSYNKAIKSEGVSNNRIAKTHMNDVVSGSSVSVMQGNYLTDIEKSGLLEKCDLYPETTMSELFPDSFFDTKDINDINPNQNQDIIRKERYFCDKDSTNVILNESSKNEKKAYDEVWTPQREESLRSFLNCLTRNMVDLVNNLSEKRIRRNILMNARALIEVKWEFLGKEKKTDYGHNKSTNTYKYYGENQIYFGLPYQQWGDYIGYYGNTIGSFLKVVNNQNHPFYTQSFRAGKYHDQELCLSHGTDCSGFVSYSIGLAKKHNTDMLTSGEDQQNLIVKVTDGSGTTQQLISRMEVGDFLVSDTHCFLIAGIYKENSEVKAVVTLESQTWTTASRQNINVYIDYDKYDYKEEKRIIAKLFGVDAGEEPVVEYWIKNIADLDEGEIKPLTKLHERIDKTYNLYRAKDRNSITHKHDEGHGIIIHYDDNVTDDLCCVTCYNNNHGTNLNEAPHLKIEGINSNFCALCGEELFHEHLFTEWDLCLSNPSKHERYCMKCHLTEYDNHTANSFKCGATTSCTLCGASINAPYDKHNYNYEDKDDTTHIKRCSNPGCTFSVEEKHIAAEPGGITCLCGHDICDHSATAKIYDSETHEIRCTRCDEVISRGKHTYKPCQYGPDPIIYNGIIDVAETEDIGDTEITCDHECLTDNRSFARIDSLIAADGLDFTESVNSVSGHYLVCTECGYMPNNTVPHSYTSFRQINGNSSSHYKVCECGATVLANHTIRIEDAVKQGCRRYCSDCGYEEYLDHDYTAYSVKTPATCTEPGEKTRTCKVCGHVRVKEIPATGHDYSKTERKEAQCKENGYERVVCSHCGDIQSETVIPYPGHDYGSPTVLSKATCTEAGHRKKTCKVCGYTKYYDYPQATGHSYETITVPATCETDGYTRVKCKTCGDIQSETILQHTGHSYGAYVVTKEPTCTAKGTKTRTCSNCGQTSTKKIPATGHSYGAFSVTTPASCTSTGTKSRTCSKCGHVDTEAIPMTAHKYNKKGKCKVCGAQK